MSYLLLLVIVVPSTDAGMLHLTVTAYIKQPMTF